MTPPPRRPLPTLPTGSYPKRLTVPPPPLLQRSLRPGADNLFPRTPTGKDQMGSRAQAPPHPQLAAQVHGGAPRGHHGRGTGEDDGAMARPSTGHTRARRKARGRQVREGARGRAALARGTTGRHERGKLLSLRRHHRASAPLPTVRRTETTVLMVSRAGERRRLWQSLIIRVARLQ